MALPIVEVSWDGAAWSDVTDRLRSWRSGHGGTPRGNPDRPFIMAASGTMVLTERPTAPPSSRYRIRMTFMDAVVWSGWAQEPQELPWPPTDTSWRLVSGNADAMARTVDIDAAAGTAAALFDLDAVEAVIGDVETTGLAARQLQAVEYNGPLGRFLSQAALAASAELLENRTGAVVAANAHLQTAPATSIPLTVRIIRIDTRRLANRIRNSIVVEIAGLHSQQTSHAHNATTTGELSLKYDIPVTGPAGATHTNWAVEVTSIEELRTSTVYETYASQGARDTGWRPPANVTEWVDISGDGATATAGAEQNGSLPVTVTVPAPTGYGYLWLRGRPLRNTIYIPGIGSVSIGYVWTETTRQTRTQTNRGRLRLTLTLTSRVSGGEAGSQTVRINNAASIATWGERPLEMPGWLLPSSASAAQTAVAALLAGLADIRSEHTATFALSHPQANRADCGDYVHLRAQDPGRGVDVNDYCVVIGRAITWTPGENLPTLQLRCLET
ncbi:hypothetical protein F4Y93_12210, partial [Candidatus Poribacteria bacterium]|nr:hypothetical protein [Candidatus Poribacteria bacterium]